MSAAYKYNFIELYSIGGGSFKYPGTSRGIWVNGERPADALAMRSFNLYLFDSTGKVTATKHYDLYASAQAGNLIEPNRMIADLNALPNGQVFALVTWDEPNNGHMKKYDGTDNVELMNAVYRVGATPSIYGVPWRPWSAYMLLGKVGSVPHLEVFDDTPRQDTTEYSNAGIYHGFSVINNKIHDGKFHNPLLTKLSDIWKDGRTYFAKLAGNWRAARKIFIKANGIWKLRYLRNAVYVVASGLNQNKYPLEYSGLAVNNVGQQQPFRSYNLALFDRNGKLGATNSYDLHGQAIGIVAGESARMIADLNALPAGQLFILYSFDEPRDGHLAPGVLDAVLRIGGTNAIYGQPMAYRGAYLLIGKVGKAAYRETYVGIDTGDGDVTGDPNAGLTQAFSVEDNEIYLLADTWTWGYPVRHPDMS